MDNLTIENIVESGSGAVKIASDVVATIAGLAASEVEGVAGMSGGVVGGIAELLGRKNLTKGIKVDAGDTEAALEVYIIVEFGSKIQEVAQNVQQNVKSAVESMTGLKVTTINVNVQGVTFKNAEPVQEETQE